MTSRSPTVEVKRRNTETATSLVRRFSRKVQQSGILIRAKKTRFKSRPKSDLRKKKEALARIKKRKKIEKLRKLGKIK